MNGIIVKLENVNGKQVPAVTSQQLAEVFGKEHYNVLRDIRETVAKCSKSFCALNFEGAEYLDEQGKSRPMYLMTKDGFTMVAMAYTTPEAMRFKEAYIAEFNRMEAELQRGTQQSLPEFPAKIEAAATSFFVLLALPAIRPRFLSIKSTGVKRDILFWRLWKWHSKRPPSGRFSTRRS